MQRKRKFYDIEDDQNSLTKEIPQRKQRVVKRCQQIKLYQNWYIYLYPYPRRSNLRDSKRKYRNQMKNYKRKINNIWEIKMLIIILMQFNKTIEKYVGKHWTKCAGDNLDKSADFIFDNSED